ncbi:MAG TPA: hypothetical protein VNA69_03680, partial [Thermoanaerobaculia bacterium]|nr:hypothetical protein [Thermoanaerobaculia bacterium]
MGATDSDSSFFILNSKFFIRLHYCPVNFGPAARNYHEGKEIAEIFGGFDLNAKVLADDGLGQRFPRR